jgi:hypothetical protein
VIIIKIWVLINMLVFALMLAPANAQQPPTAIQRCGNVVGSLEIQAATLGEQLDLAALQTAKDKARIKELEDKYEPKPAPTDDKR